MKENGKKFDQNPLLKPRIGLVPLRAMWQIAQVMTFGAQKYSDSLNFDSNSMLEWYRKELEQWQNQNVNIVTEVILFSQEACVDVATTGGLKNKTQNMPNVSEKTIRNGGLRIKKEFENISESAWKILNLEKETNKQNTSRSSKIEGSQKKQINFYYETKKINALSAKENLAKSKCILITTIKQDSQEDTYVVGATTVLGSLMTASQILKEQFPIFRKVQQINILGERAIVKITGAHNWKGGIRCSRLVDAAMRHIIQFNEGETLDTDSGLPHLAHAGCCITMLLEMMMDRPDLDDRYTENKSLPWRPKESLPKVPKENPTLYLRRSSMDKKWRSVEVPTPPEPPEGPPYEIIREGQLTRGPQKKPWWKRLLGKD
jgi:hypothetical protein